MNATKLPKIAHLLKKIDITSNPLQAYQYAIEAEEIAIAKKDKKQIASVQLVLANLLIQNGAYTEALAKTWSALQYFSNTEEINKEAKCWKYIALIYGFLGEKNKQLAYNKKCLTLTQQFKDPIEEIKILNNIGHTYLDLKEYDKAETIFKENLEKAYLTTDLHAVSLKNLGKLYFEKRDYNKAKTIFKITTSIARKHNLPQYIVASNHFLGHIYYNQGQIEEALIYFKRAIEGIGERDILKAELRMQLELYLKVLLEAGKMEAAKDCFEKYIALSKNLTEQTKAKSIKNLQFQLEINEVAKERNSLVEENEELQLANAKIEAQQKVLIAQSEQLQSANQELREFAHRIAHDLKQPIRTISNFIRLFEKEVGDNLSERGGEFMHFINTATLEITQFVDDILLYAESDQSTQTIEVVNCNELIAHIKRRLSAQLSETKTAIICDKLPSVKAHQSLLLQVFQNLISNAIKFRRSEVAPIIKIRGMETTTHTVFEIEDNGIGIKKENQEKIFHLFARLHNKTTYEGSGIGLSTVLKILKKYNATIEVSSIYGEGSTFRLLFLR